MLAMLAMRSGLRYRPDCPDTPESHVRAPAVHRAVAPTADQIAGAVLVGTEKRAAALDALGHARFCGIVAVGWAGGIDGNLRQRAVVVGPIPVGAPLPDIAAHVEQIEAVGRKGRHRGCATEAVDAGVRDGELS